MASPGCSGLSKCRSCAITAGCVANVKVRVVPLQGARLEVHRTLGVQPELRGVPEQTSHAQGHLRADLPAEYAALFTPEDERLSTPALRC